MTVEIKKHPPDFRAPQPAVGAERFHVRLADGGVVVLAFRVVEGGAPVMILDPQGRTFTPAEWATLVEGIDRAWKELTASCACSHTFGLHAHESPHGCLASSDCRCEVFRAASPFYVPTATPESSL